MNDKPIVPYWHLWTDADGVSRQSRCAMTEFEMKSMQPPADPQWQGRKMHGAMSMMITVQPIGWTGAWHENPKPQWIVPLSGRWFVESMDGTRVEMGPGEFSFGGDQHCVEHDGRKGHTSGTVGDAAAVLMVIQFDAVPLDAIPLDANLLDVNPLDPTRFDMTRSGATQSDDAAAPASPCVFR